MSEAAQPGRTWDDNPSADHGSTAPGSDSAAPRGAGVSGLSALGPGLAGVPPVRLRDLDGDAPPAPAGAEPASAPAGRYQFLGEVARGGMGAVLRARDADLGRTIAVKVLLEEHGREGDLGQRFLEEAQITGQLQHPGIVPVHELGRLADGRPYFTMKLVKGQTLARLLAGRQDPARDRPRFLKVFEQVCQALAYAHARGVIHRDLKPSNVMVGAFGEVQVMDWGLAKVLRPAGDDAEASRERKRPEDVSVIRTARDEEAGGACPPTQAGTVLGTWAYMPREQALGEVERLDERSDVFGLGAILCEILTGRPPYAGGDGGEVKRKAMRADLAEALARLDGCGADAELVHLARRCLAAEPDGRPRRAGELAAAVTAYLESAEQRLRRAELERARAQVKAREERKRRRLTVALGVPLLGLVLLAAGGGLWLQGQVAEQQTEAQRQAAERRAAAARQQAERRAEAARRAAARRVEAARRSEARRQAVAAALARVAELQRQARWREARVVLDEAARGLGAGGPAGLRPRLARARTVLRLLERLEAARMRAATIVKGRFDREGAAREYAAALKEAGLGEVGKDFDGVLKRLRALPGEVRTQVVAALDDWALREASGGALRFGWTPRAWALALARRADDDRDPWKNRFRDPRVWGSREALEGLAREAKVGALAPQTLHALALALAAQGGDPVPLLRAAQAHHPADFWLNYDLGLALDRAKHREEAVGYYRAALAVRPGASAVYGDLGSALRAKHPDEALVAYRKAVALAPEDAWAHADLGDALLEKGRPEEALAAFQKAVALDARCTTAYAGLGEALRQKGRLDEAVAALRKAAATNDGSGPSRERGARPSSPARAHAGLGAALQEQGRLDEAIAAFRKAVALDPTSARAHARLGDALRRKGRTAEAIAALRRALDLDPKDAWAHAHLGEALQDKGRTDEAIVAFRKAIALDPKDAWAYGGLGEALRVKGRMDDAIAALRRALALDPRDAFAHGSLGAALLEKGRVDEAVVAYRKAVALDPKYAWAYANLGEALRRKDRTDEAIVAFREALALKPTDAWAVAGLGLALRAKGRTDEALDAYQKLVALTPKDAWAHERLGSALLDKGRVDEAVAAYRKAVALDPKNAWAHSGLGFGWYAKNDLTRAVAAYRKAAALAPKEALFHTNLGRSLRELGRLDEAVTACRKAVALAPRNAWAHIELGEALRLQARTDEAIAAYQEAVNLDPKNAWAHNGLGLALGDKAVAFRDKQGLPTLGAGTVGLMGSPPGPGPLLATSALVPGRADNGLFDKAVAAHHKAIALRPNSAVFRRDLGISLQEKGQPEEAIAAFRKAVALAPNYADAHGRLAHALRLLGRTDEAIASYQKAAVLDPRQAWVHTGLGLTLRDRGRLDEAIAAYKKAVALAPKDAWAHAELGDALLLEDAWASIRMGDALPPKDWLDEAIAALRRAVAIDPKYAWAHARLGDALLKEGRTDEAITAFRKAITLNPRDAWSLIGLGHALRRKGRLGEAAEAYQKALALDPKDAWTSFWLGEAWEAQRDFAKAAAAYRKAVSLDPRQMIFHANLGDALRHLGRLEEAVAAYQEAAALDPKSAVTHANLGQALLLQGRADEAIVALQKAIRLDLARRDLGGALALVWLPWLASNQGDAWAHRDLGAALALKGRADEAVAAFRKAVALDPKDAQGYAGLGLALLDKGRADEAREAFRRAHALYAQDKSPEAAGAAPLGRRCARLAAAAPKLPALLKGTHRPKDNAERLALADACGLRRRNLEAARLYAEAFAADPRAADDLKALYRYAAASAAAQAAAGHDPDAARLDARGRARWRNQALDWLRADLALWQKQLEGARVEDRRQAQDMLRWWQQDPDFAGVRGPEALARLPEGERRPWQALWRDVATVLAKAR
jgi:serine/threonine-protein kinase